MSYDDEVLDSVVLRHRVGAPRPDAVICSTEPALELLMNQLRARSDRWAIDAI